MEEPIKDIEVQENRDENVDNLLDSVSDKYLAKKKRTRIISYSVILFVVLALAISIITLSLIRVDLRPSFIGEGASSYDIVYNNKTISIDPVTQKKDYDKFTGLFLNAFKTYYLTALFEGRLGGYDIDEKDIVYPFYGSNESLSSTVSGYLGNNYVRIRYNEKVQILNSDGSKYYSTASSNTTLTFNDVCFPLSTVNDETNLVFYIGAYGYLSKTDARIFKISVKANTYSLYQYAKDNIRQ